MTLRRHNPTTDSPKWGVTKWGFLLFVALYAGRLSLERWMIVNSSRTTSSSTVAPSSVSDPKHLLRTSTSENVIVTADIVDEYYTKQDHNPRHFFDCNAEDALCTWFRPLQFFDTPSSPGYTFRQRAHAVQYNNSLPDGIQPHLTPNYARAVLKKPHLGVARPDEQFPGDLTYVHVKKAGGITMKYAFQMFEAPYRIGANYSSEVIYTSKHDAMGPIKFQKNVQDFVNKTQLFSFVRHPIDKFLSGSSQAVKGHQKGEPCGNDIVADTNATGKMQCFLSVLKQGQFVNEHLHPMSVELYQFIEMATQRRQDIGNAANSTSSQLQIALFPLTQIPAVLEYMGVPVFQSNGKRQTGYDRRHLTPQMTRDICELFQADVVLMRQLQLLEKDPMIEECPM